MARILILGGTQFIGRHLVERLSAEGRYALTIFNRGRTNPELFPEVDRIVGDREAALPEDIFEQAWEAVIDCSGYYPDSLSNMLDRFQGECKRYIFISTCSVYDNEADKTTGKTEEAPVLQCLPGQRRDSSPYTYGARKAACEDVLRQSGLPHLIVRPSLVYGPHDHTDRFYYWPHQVYQNETLLLPDGGQRLFSLTWVGDLAAAIKAGLEGLEGTFNVTSHPACSIKAIVAETQNQLKVQQKIVNLPPAFLHEQSVAQWSDLPCWIDGDHFTYRSDALQATGLWHATPLAEGIRQTIAYQSERGWPQPKAGMGEDRRQELMSLFGV